MVLTKTNNEASLPLLQDYFDIDIKYEHKNTILKYHELVNKKVTRNEYDGCTISVGLNSYSIHNKYVFIWKVRDVIRLIEMPDLITRDTIIICNLETHFHELKLLGFEVESVYQKLGRNIPFIEKKEGMSLILRNKYGVSINPTSLSDVDVLNCKALVKYRVEAFEPSDDNYSNEFCEVYQIAAILEVPVYTITNEHELNTIKKQLENKRP